jgi:RNA polymerase sigma factor (sigma-70 family)
VRTDAKNRELSVLRDDRELIDLILKGDRAATLESLNWIREVLSFHGWGDRIDRDDLLQESYLALVRNLREGRYRAEGGGLRSYVQSIARKQCLRALRKSYSRRQPDMEPLTVVSDNPGPDAMLESAERRKLGLRVLRSLKADCRKLLIWKFVKEQSYQVIGSRLGIEVVAARVRLHRCLETAREMVRAWEK